MSDETKTSKGNKRENIPKMRDLLSKANAGDCPLFMQGMSKRLEFSQMSLCVYEGHKSLISNIFLNSNIK